MPYNYVKFQRGTLAAYERLRNKDPDTLYFIYADEQHQYGSLYLGDKLISGGEISVVSASLSDLSDVVLSGTLQDGMLLQYQVISGEGKWRSIALADVVADLPSSEPATIVNNLNNITNPSEGDLAVVENTMYIYDGSEWVPITNDILEDKVADLETLVGHPADNIQDIPATGLFADIAALDAALDNVYTKQEINNLIADGTTHLKYRIVESLDDINLSSQEIDYTIYLVPKGTIESNNGYDEYFVISNNLEKIGTSSVNLNDYVQTNDNRLLTNEQKTKLNAITLDGNNNLTITAAQVSDLNTAINNGQFIKSVDVGTFAVDQSGNLSLISIPSNVLDLSDYALASDVGDLSTLIDRVANDSSLVDEINSIKGSIIWNDMNE